LRLRGALRGELARAARDRLELRARAEGGHPGRRDAHAGAGCRVARGAGGALAALEDAEAGDRDLLAARDGRVHGVDHRVERGGRALAVTVQALGEQLDELGLVRHWSSCGRVSLGATLVHGAPVTAWRA